MRLKTRSALAALPLVLALSLTGCGGDDDGGGIATAGGDRKTGASASPASSTDRKDMALKFAQCMRQNGIPMEDPVDGRLTLRNDGSIPREKFDKAQEACRQYSPQANQNPQEAKAAEERGRRFAECMRKNGVENFPDPQPGQQGIRITGEVGQDPDLEKAQQTCQEILGGAPRQGGGGAGGGGR